MFTLPPLPYPLTALAPHISEETLKFHHGKHHQAYVDNLNKLLAAADKPTEKQTLESLIMTATGPTFNNAAQIWNHTFYWKSMKPASSDANLPQGKVLELIKRDFGSFDEFKTKFSAAATGHFGSGWAWLVLDSKGILKIVQTHDAAHPLREQLGSPVLVCDVWEHAYYVDYRNARAKYVEAWWGLVNWEFANANIAHPVKF